MTKLIPRIHGRYRTTLNQGNWRSMGRFISSCEWSTADMMITMTFIQYRDTSLQIFAHLTGMLFFSPVSLVRKCQYATVNNTVLLKCHSNHTMNNPIFHFLVYRNCLPVLGGLTILEDLVCYERSCRFLF